MGYVDSNLMTGETVRYHARLHWSIYIVPVLASLILIGIPFLIGVIIRAKTSEFVVTSRRVIIKTGLISRKTVELNLQKVESIGVDQPIMGRILGYGSIRVVGTGGTNEPFHEIDDPMAFRKAVTEAAEAAQNIQARPA